MNNRIITALATILAVPAMAAPAGYFQVPGTETTLKVYGFAQVDGVYDIDGNYGMDSGLNPTNVQHESLALDNQWHWRSKARFGFTSTTPSALGDVMMKIEFQASDTVAAKGVNVRHAYGKIGGLTVGNTDSIFADWDASPNYMDNDGVLADFYGNGRVNQVSYAFEPTKGVNVAFGIEQDKTGSTDKYFPGALVAAAGYSADWGHVRASVAFAKAKIAAVAGTNPDLSKSQASFGLGANYVVGKGNITAQFFQGVGFYGVDTGDGYYLVDTDGVTTTFETIKTQKVTGMTLGYSHAVTDAITVATGFGEAKWKKDKDVFPATITVDNFFVNCQWQATKTASFGVEYFMSQAKLSDGAFFVKKDTTHTDKAKESRLNLRAKFNMF